MNTRTITRLGLMLAMVVTLTALEQMIPAIPFLPPGMKPGFSHVVTMFCVFHVGKGQAMLLGILKSLFVLLTRGLMAAALSLAGGMLSLAVVITLAVVFSSKVPYITVAVIGAVTHNVTQLGVYSLIMRVNMLFFYMPVLIVSGIIAGVATGALSGALTPFLKHLPGDRPV